MAIGSTPAGGGSSTTARYLWCGDRICQARNSAGSPQCSYFDEGEFVSGSPNQPLYYGGDQIGSVRRVFASATSAPAYDYDPFGVPLQATAPMTEFGFAGMMSSADSGLGLTWYCAYDPVVGRWLSRDPLGDDAISLAQRVLSEGPSLYAYVSNNPLSTIDVLGLAGQGTPGNNQAQNKQFRDICVSLGLSKDQG